ncbi:trypsin-like peptidase domain-containing protein [Streptomyces sp. NPDC005070]
MNEGRPTKAKWWSRPRPEAEGTETAPAHPTEPDPTHPAAAPTTTDGAEPAAPEPHPGEIREGRTGAAPSAPEPWPHPGDARGGGTGGDYELERPARVPVPAQAGPPTFSAPAPPADAQPGAGAEAGGGRDTATDTAGDGNTGNTAGVGGAGESGDGGDLELQRPDARRPAPLHAPDPHGTPPYGRPGPWAPAPPVQHPVGHPTAPPASEAPAEPVEAATPDPWRNYDPWAATPGSPREHGHLQHSGPFQQNGMAVPTVAQRRGRARKSLALAAVVLALVSGGVGGVVGAYLERNGGLTDVELPQAAKEAPGRAPDSVAGIAAHALPSVVTLHVHGSEEDGTGTGFVLDGEGHILTNNHVIDPAGGNGTITVTFSGGETAKARVVGHDSGYDLAVVKVSGVGGLAPIALGNSDSVQVGDPVVAIGAPFDLANTVTSGIISAKDRPITAGGEKGDGSDVSYVDALQTDAPINPGNSGGPLLDSRARVIGINSAIRSADSGSDLGTGQAGSIGLGFAIPVNQAKRVAEELINTGRATHPVIGVTLDMNYTGDGARVGAKAAGGGASVTVGGPGAKAGIKAGDVITEVDGTRVHSGEELIVKTRAHRPGDHLRLTVRRGGADRTITLVLGSADGG